MQTSPSVDSTSLPGTTKPPKDPKINIYNVVVLTTLLYGTQSWAIYHCQICLLEHFHQCCLETILKIHWRDFVTNVEILKLVKISSIEVLLIKALMHWSGHIFRMDDHCLLIFMPYEQLATGPYNRGHPWRGSRIFWKQCTTANCIDHHQWAMLTADWVTWRQTAQQAKSLFKNNKKAAMSGGGEGRRTMIVQHLPLTRPLSAATVARSLFPG